MRRMMALLALLAVVQVSSGCRHVAGSCDCEHGGSRTDGGCGCGSVAKPSNPGVCGYYGSGNVVPLPAAAPPPPPIRSTVYQSAQQ